MSEKNSRRREWGADAAAAGHDLAAGDAAQRARDLEDRSQRAEMPLARIRPRLADTRPLNERHIAELMESIRALGLLEPLVVDVNGRLLAGAHRLAAIHRLHDTAPADFAATFVAGKIPVRVLPFDADDQPQLAIDIEVAENEHRRDYTTAELCQIIARLRAAGFRDGAGRPRPGDRLLKDALARIIGKSRRTVERLMAGLRDADAAELVAAETANEGGTEAESTGTGRPAQTPPNGEVFPTAAQRRALTSLARAARRLLAEFADTESAALPLGGVPELPALLDLITGLPPLIDAVLTAAPDPPAPPDIPPPIDS